MKGYLRSFPKSVWLFPILPLLVICALSALRISGSSVGMYHQLLYGSGTDKNLLLGSSQPIRSDEWMVGTPLTVSQSHFGYPQIDPMIGDGFDASILADLPAKDWSAIFKPQNLSFFVLPLEQAFALKWWILGYLLIVSAYFLTLILLPGRRLVAAFLSSSLFFSPFVQWWYLTGTLGSIAYCILASVIFIHLIRSVDRKKTVWLTLALAYVLTCFALLIYPPFQIPCALAAAALCMGFLLEETKLLTWRLIVKKLMPAVVAVVVCGVMVGLFVVTRSQTISAITGTVYPGHRVAASGGYPPYLFMDGFLDNRLQDLGRASHYVSNQSEDSSFIYLWPYLIIPSIFLLVRQRRARKQFDYALLFVNVLLVIFAARMLLPMPEVLAKVFLLSSIPHDRLKIGLGVLNFLQLVLVLRHLRQSKLPRSWAIGFGGLAVVAQMIVGYTILHNFPLYSPRVRVFGLLALTVGLIVYLALRRHLLAMGAVLLGLSLFTSLAVNPLYVGLGELTHSRLGDAAKSDPGGTQSGWVYMGNMTSTNVLAAYGLHSYSGTFLYPQMAYLKELDPDGKYTNVYNRYAHAIYGIGDPAVKGFRLNSPDSYSVDFRPCASPFKEHIQRIASQLPLGEPCLKLDVTVTYPANAFYIYSVH
ncbi:MAG TPA: hypothetical protein VMT30_08795 [Candidatus Saccharimonadia bacterium]|nr:hypothetical protein [Candidatus Saccharimonadia bacterium]